MRLLWLNYDSSKGTKYILCLELGTRGDKLCVIDNAHVDSGSRQRILSELKSLEGLTLEKKIMWVKRHCPKILSGFRTLKNDKVLYKKYYELRNGT